MKTNIITGNCLEVLKTLHDNSVDSIVTDPPYGWSFMGKKWDYDVPKVEVWKEALRVLKPGGHALVACGTRTQHRMAVNLEDAGFEIRDIVAWVYGSGFPKSLNIGKAVDKLQGNEREYYERPDFVARSNKTKQRDSQVPCGEKGKYTKGSSPWEGWGTALKPSMELWTLCRKPLEEKTVAENVLKWGTGGINIEGCRVDFSNKEDKAAAAAAARQHQQQRCNEEKHQTNVLTPNGDSRLGRDPQEEYDRFMQNTGRFPANLIHDGSDEVVGLFPNNSQRFFYCAKASKSERNRGLEEFNQKANAGSYHFLENGSLDGKVTAPKANFHPTVKPVALMRYLCRLITPPKGIVLDCFMGSGTTGIAAKQENFDFIGIELMPEYVEIAQARINGWQPPQSSQLELI